MMSEATRIIRATPRVKVPLGQVTMRGGLRVGQSFTLNWDSHQVLNGHTIIVGGSGAGKTYQLRKLVKHLAEAGLRVHVIDVHGDIVPDCSTHSIRFSESTEFGLNPLEVSGDPDFGGPRKKANAFINLMLRQSTLGEKQKSALFRLLMDLYRRWGFYPEDAATWGLDVDPRAQRQKPVIRARPGMRPLPNLNWFEKGEDEKNAIKRDYGLRFYGDARVWEIAETHPKLEEALALWGGDAGKRHPALSDLRKEVWTKLVSLKLTGGSSAARKLEDVMRLQKRLKGLKVRNMKGDDVEAQLGKAKADLLATLQDAMDHLDSGEELEEMIAWDSADAIKGLYDRIESMERSGIFKGRAPEFDPARAVWRYDISPLSREEAQFFVDCLCGQIFAEAKQNGEAEGPDTVIVIDEASIFLDKDPDHILNIIAREARKFGIMVILAAQELNVFPQATIGSSASKVILGVDEVYHKATEQKLGMEAGKLKFIRPQETALVQIKNKGKGEGLTNKFWEVSF